MATDNFFDRYDEQPQGVPTQETTGNFFDQYDPPEEEALTKGTESPGWVSRMQEYGQKAGTGIVDEMLGEYVDKPGPEIKGAGLVEDLDNMVKGTVRAVGGDIIPAVSNMVIDSGFTLAKKVIPEEAQEWIVDYSKAAWDKIAANPLVAQGLDAVKAGTEAYTEWAKENPRDAKQLEAAVNVSGMLKPKGTPISSSMQKNIRETSKSNRRVAVRDMMEPIGKKGEGTLYIDNNLWQTKKYKPSAWEDTVNDAVMKVPEVNPRKAYTDNMNAVRNRAEFHKEELENFILNKKKNPVINTTKLKTGLANKVNAIDEDTLLVGNAREQAIKIYTKAQELIDASDGTSMGILQARRDLDKWILKSKSKVFDSDMESAIGVAAREIRGAMNDAVSDSTKSTRVRTLLDNQHQLLSAGDMLEAKALKEADGRVGRIIEKMEKATGDKLPTTPLAQVATATAALATVPVWGPVAATIGGYKGLKWLATGPGKKWLAEMVKHAETIPALRPEVNALIQLSQGLTPEDD